MLMLKKAGILVLALSFITVFSLSAPAEILFEDDFEADDIGDEPALWNATPGFTLEVVEDPEDPGNKVLSQLGEANGLGPPTPVGWEDQDFWTDYIWEFDWYWGADTFVGTVQRYQDPQHYLHISRRMGGNLTLFNWGGDWNNILQESPWGSDIQIWYRMQISDIGDEHIAKGKESVDDTPFDELAPMISAEDDSYPEGPIGLFGLGDDVGGGTLFWDNIIVYEPGTDISGAVVEPTNKLSITWGKIKTRN